MWTDVSEFSFNSREVLLTYDVQRRRRKHATDTSDVEEQTTHAQYGLQRVSYQCKGDALLHVTPVYLFQQLPYAHHFQWPPPQARSRITIGFQGPDLVHDSAWWVRGNGWRQLIVHCACIDVIMKSTPLCNAAITPLLHGTPSLRVPVACAQISAEPRRCPKTLHLLCSAAILDISKPHVRCAGPFVCPRDEFDAAYTTLECSYRALVLHAMPSLRVACVQRPAECRECQETIDLWFNISKLPCAGAWDSFCALVLITTLHDLSSDFAVPIVPRNLPRAPLTWLYMNCELTTCQTLLRSPTKPSFAPHR